MKNIVILKDINYKYNEKPIFVNFNLEIKESSFTTIVGPNGSGKSTLVKILLGLVTSDGHISVNHMAMNKNNIMKIRKDIGVVLENPDNQFICETVADDIAFTLENMCYDPKEIDIIIEKIADLLDISDILDRNPNSLSGGEKQLVAFASALVKKPSILIFDEAFSMIDNHTKEIIYNLIQDLNKKEKITIINITHNLEDALYGNQIVVISNGKLIENGSTKRVLNKKSVLTELGLDLPFMVELSDKLKYYQLVDKTIYRMEEMVNKLWP